MSSSFQGGMILIAELNKYKTSQKWDLDDISIYLLKVNINIDSFELDVIPQSQKQDVAKYHLRLDRQKRLLARSFLFEHCQRQFRLNRFDFAFNGYQQPRFKYSDIQFSFSYAGDYVLVGISTKKKLGVDIEYKDKSLDFE